MGLFTFQKLNNVPADQCKLNLLCFHWAGGSGIAFKPLAKYLETSSISVYSLTLPGRNGRGTATMFRSMADIKQSLLPEFVTLHTEQKLSERPLVFFGHSFGGLLAYELYKSVAMQDEPGVIIEKIIVSAVRCPADLTELNKDKTRVYHHKQTNRELTDYMRSIGGIPPGVDPSIIEMMLPTIKGDYEVFETYDMGAFGSPVVPCPLTVFYAKRDASVEAPAALGWQEHTSEEFTLVEFEQGGHFYITDAGTKEEFYAKLKEECEKHMTGGGGCTLA